MRTKKLFTCVIAALTLMYSSGCCDTQSCYTVSQNPCNPCVQTVPCTPARVRCKPAPAPAPVVIECPPVVECAPKPKKQRKVKKRYANCLQPKAHCYYEIDPCAGNPPLLIQSIAPTAIVVAAPSSIMECPPAAPAKVAECLPVTVEKKKVRGRTRTIIPVINNNVSRPCEPLPAKPTYATTYAVNMTGMKTQPVYLPEQRTVESTPDWKAEKKAERKAERAAKKQEKLEAKLEPIPEPAPEAKLEPMPEPVAQRKAEPKLVEVKDAPRPETKLQPIPEARIEPVYEQKPALKSDRSGLPLLNESPLAAPSAPMPMGPQVSSAPAASRLEPIPYTSPLDSPRGMPPPPAAVNTRLADPFLPVVSPPAARPVTQAPMQQPQMVPAARPAYPMPQGQVAGYQSQQQVQLVAGQQIQPGQVVEPWMLQPRERVTASGFEPGVLPGCPPAIAGGCPPSASGSPCGPVPCGPAVPPPAPIAAPMPPANCPPEICPQPFVSVCLPGQGLSDCFTMNDQQLMTGPQVLTPNAMTPLPIAAPASIPPLSVPGQAPAPAPRAEPQGKYGALIPPAPQAQDFGRAEPRPAELSMPAPIGGNIPPVVPTSEIESALDAMLFRDATMSSY